MSDNRVVQNLQNTLGTWKREAGRNMDTADTIAKSIQGRRHMERNS